MIRFIKMTLREDRHALHLYARISLNNEKLEFQTKDKVECWFVLMGQNWCSLKKET